MDEPITEALIEQDAAGTITDWNAEAERLFGWTRAEAIGMPASTLIPERNRERHAAGIRALLSEEDRTVWKRDLTGVDRWGREFPVRFTVAADKRSGATRVTALAREITATNRADGVSAAFASCERYRAVLDQIEDGCCAVDLRGNYVFVNDAFCRMFGFDRAEILGGSFKASMSPERAAELKPIYEEVYRTGQPAKAYRYQVAPRNPSTRYVEQTISLERDEAGEPIGFLAITRDCTARKEAEIEVERAKEAAEAANRAKSEFLANMSHEIRTPMNGIIGLTTLAMDEASPPQREYLTTIAGQARALLTIINDILDFSKIESRKLALESIDFCLEEVVEPTVTLLAPQAAAKGVALTWTVAPGVPRRIVGDAVRLRQVLTNLAANAVKFTEHGAVTIAVSLETSSPSEATVHFTVQDTGIGIPADKQGAIFEAFQQADGSMTRRFGGTGLGLAIASELVRLMRGRIWVESQPGVGSTFHFTATFGLSAARSEPRERLASQPRSSGPATTRPRLRVLVAEDNVVNQRVASGLLSRRGHAVTMVANGREAVSAVEREAFDLVLMDVQMPDMNGFEATEAIRALERTINRRVRVIAMTAHAMAGDRERCLAAGMDGYVAKPIDPEELFAAVEQA